MIFKRYVSCVEGNLRELQEIVDANGRTSHVSYGRKTVVRKINGHSNGFVIF